MIHYLLNLTGDINALICNSYMSNARDVFIIYNNNLDFIIHGEKKYAGCNLLPLDLYIEDNRVTPINKKIKSDYSIIYLKLNLILLRNGLLKFKTDKGYM